MSQLRGIATKTWCKFQIKNNRKKLQEIKFCTTLMAKYFFSKATLKAANVNNHRQIQPSSATLYKLYKDI